MKYVLDHFQFDTLTIVDSDQLLLRSHYTRYLSAFFSNGKISQVGMLSSAPEQVTKANQTNLVARQAFKEYDLWKPFLETFLDGETKFVHWTFWPSSVFTFPAVRDLMKLFKENHLVQRITRQTRIWATEEVIFPTLVRLLGYEIALNPCSYDFVQYRKHYTAVEIENALAKPDVFWLHPVRRKFDDPLRQMIREKFNDYTRALYKPGDKTEIFQSRSELKKAVGNIEGWLSDNEVDQLIDLTMKTCALFPGFNNIVEIGSYHGKSTVVFGTVLKTNSYQGKVYAIDMHDGKLGALDQGLRSFPPSFEKFITNIEAAGLTRYVEIIRDKATNVEWDRPISLLFIDGLHDYESAAGDFRHFQSCIYPGGFVVFHDYADYFPGVKKMVHEILAYGKYIKVSLTDTLMVLQKVKGEK